MKIQVNKEQFVKKFLSPVSKVYNECSINFTNENIFTVLNDQDENVILFCKLKATTGLDSQSALKLNIKDIRKLMKVLDCTSSEIIELDIDDNCSVLKYKSTDLSFKLHLVTDSVIRKVSISTEKINKMTFNTDFVLPETKLQEILKGSVFATDTNKVYFYTKDGLVHAELTDKSTQNLDSITFSAANTYTGEEIKDPIPFSLEFFRSLSSSTDGDIKIKINNTFKIMMFEVINTECTMKYIVSSFTK